MASNQSSWLSLFLLHSALLFVQLGTSGYQIVTRVALTGGMSLFTFAVYRGAIGLVFLVPAAFFLERNKRPPLTWTLLGHFFLLGLTGVFLSQAFFLAGLSYTSPTFAAAIQNSIPAITFIIAVAFGQEKVHFRRRDGQAKVLGTILCVIGATLMVFYKGPPIIKVVPNDPSDMPKLAISHMTKIVQNDVMNANLFIHDQQQPEVFNKYNTKQVMNDKLLTSHTKNLTNLYYPININRVNEKMKNWQLGAFYHMGMCIAFSFWLVIQGPVIRQYPARLSVTTFSSFFGTLQLLVLALVKERNPSRWILPWGPQLLSVLYAGFIVSGLVFSIQMWCVQKGGAVLTAVYQPAQTIIVAILTLLFLRENFYLGSLIGGLLIIIGLYLVTWGQGYERKCLSSCIPTSIPPCEHDPKSTNPQVVIVPENNSSLVQPLLTNDHQDEVKEDMKIKSST